MNQTTEKRDVYTIVTERIIEQLQKGVVPWKKPWSTGGLPQNLVTRKVYRGINVWLLTSLNYSLNYFLTFKQLRELGGRVKKDEKSNIVVFWKWVESNEVQSQFANRKPISKKAIHLFSGILICHCGGKMYVPSRTKKYVCNSCGITNISVDDIEEIYFEQLKSFLLTKNDLATFLHRASDAISAKETELENLHKQKEKIKREMDKLIELHSKGELPTEGFGSYYKPLDTQIKQVENTIIESESQIDFLKIQQLNGDHILENAETLYDRWPSLEPEAKRQIIEELTQSITLGDEEIKITFCYTPNLLGNENTPKGQHNVKGS